MPKPKWKVAVRVINHQNNNPEINHGIVMGLEGHWLVADRIVSIDGIPFDRIPSQYRHKGSGGDRRECVFLKTGITLDDFEVEVLDA